jgi:exodeoxyribonuclease-3
MKIYSWNVNGIRAVQKKGLFVPFVETYRPDIFCLQETKTMRGQSEVDLPGYEEYWNAAEQKGYSGTAIFTQVQPRVILHDLPEAIEKMYSLNADRYGDPNKEGRVIAAEFDRFFVVTVYTPNVKDNLSRLPLRYKQWDPAFLAYCRQLEQKKPVICCGDLNVAHTPDDLARPGENEGKQGYTREEREGFQHFIDAGFVDTFRLFHQGNGYYTWWAPWANARARNIGWRLDYILVSESLRNTVRAAEIHPDLTGSDHCPVSIELALE